LKSELTSFKNKCQSVNRNICNLDDVISSISTSTQTQEQKVTSLENFSKSVEQFASDVAQIDGNVADMVNKNKDDFYDKYHYLKPDCEKGWLEKGWDDFKSGCAKAGEWCKEHWKIVVTVILVVAAIVVIVLTAGAALGTLATLLVMVAKGIIIGAAIGGLFAAAGHGLAKKFPVLLKGITSGRGSWSHVWATQSARSLNHGTKVSLKTILKGVGAEVVKDAWDYCLEPIKSRIDKWKESWNLIPQH